MHLSPQQAHHGVRLPFDVLLGSLAESCGGQTICVAFRGPVPMSAAGLPRSRRPAAICRRTVLADHAPAAILINRQRQCLYSMGPIERYLHIAPGDATLDLLAMATPALRTKLRLAIDKASRASEQEYRRGPRHQPAHRGKPPRRDHAQDEGEVAPRTGPDRAGRCGRDIGHPALSRSAILPGLADHRSMER